MFLKRKLLCNYQKGNDALKRATTFFDFIFLILLLRYSDILHPHEHFFELIK